MSGQLFDKVTIHTIDPDGWPIDFDVTPQPGRTAEAIAFLQKHGYQPAPVAETSQGYQYTPEGLPICPKHGEAMRKREKQGDTWYSHKVKDEDGRDHYCRGYRTKNGPGWAID